MITSIAIYLFSMWNWGKDPIRETVLKLLILGFSIIEDILLIRLLLRA